MENLSNWAFDQSISFKNSARSAFLQLRFSQWQERRKAGVICAGGMCERVMTPSYKERHSNNQSLFQPRKIIILKIQFLYIHMFLSSEADVLILCILHCNNLFLCS